MRITISKFFSKLYYQERAREDLSPRATDSRKQWSINVEKQAEVVGLLRQLDELGATVLRVDPVFNGSGNVQGFRIDYEHSCEIPGVA